MQQNYPELCRTLGIWPILEVSSLCAEEQVELGTGTLFRNNLHAAMEAAVTWLPSVTFALTLAHAPAAIRLPKWKERYVCDQKMAAKSIYLGFFATLANHSGSIESETYISQRTKYSLQEAAKQLFLTKLNHSIQRMSASLPVSLKLSPLAYCHS